MDPSLARQRRLDQPALARAVIQRAAQLGLEGYALCDATGITPNDLRRLSCNCQQDIGVVLALCDFVGRPLESFVGGPRIDDEAEAAERAESLHQALASEEDPVRRSVLQAALDSMRRG